MSGAPDQRPEAKPCQPQHPTEQLTVNKPAPIGADPGVVNPQPKLRKVLHHLQSGGPGAVSVAVAALGGEQEEGVGMGAYVDEAARPVGAVNRHHGGLLVDAIVYIDLRGVDTQF